MQNTATQMTSQPDFALRDYQEKAATAALEDLKTVRKVALIMPTGSGKTETFIEISKRYLRANPYKSVLILSHLDLLTQQTKQRFELRAPDITVGIFQGDEFPHRSSKVVIGTMQTSRTGHKTDRLKLRIPREVGLIIIDEAHYLTCDSYEMALGAFPDALQIGCTATPFRSGALMTNYFDKISFSISIKELIAAGHLVEPNLVQVADDSTEIESKMALVASIYKEKELGKHAIIFMKTMEDAKQMRNVLDDHGISARAVTHELVGEEREQIFRDFRAGKIKVLTTVNVLTAGFDAKNIQAIFMPYPTKSPTTWLQRIGRGLRPDHGKTDCRIYVCGSTPSVARDEYKKLHETVLGDKKKKTTTFEEDYEYGEEVSTEIYTWNGVVVETVKRMRDLKLDRLADLLNKKKFPKRFMDDIVHFKKGLIPTGGIDAANAPASKVQLDMLKQLGFTKDCVKGITKQEASALVAAGVNVKRVWEERPNTLTSGKYPGAHYSDLPKVYVALMKNKYPFSAIAKKLREYEAKGGTYKFGK